MHQLVNGVDRCITYHDVENNHGVPNICDVPDFKAKKTTHSCQFN